MGQRQGVVVGKRRSERFFEWRSKTRMEEEIIHIKKGGKETQDANLSGFEV